MASSNARPEHDNHDDDSHTTLNRGEEENDVDSCATSVDLLAPPTPPQKISSAAAAAPSPAAPSPAPSISPSTQTLNVLSQHDAVGGGNLRYDMNNLNQDVSAVTASQQVRVSARDDFRGWKLITVALTKPGCLGMTVRRLPLEDPSQSYTIVNKVHPNSQAEAAAILAGDVIAAEHDEVIKWKDGPRPVAFSIVRRPETMKRKSTPPHQSTAAPSHPLSISSFASTQRSSAQAKTPVLAKSPAAHRPKVVTEERPVGNSNVAADNANEEDTQAAIILAHKLAATILPPTSRDNNTLTVDQQQQSKSSSQLPDEHTNNKDDDTVPFCKACRNLSITSRVHHALCPKHPQFDNSGALEKLQLIRRGVETGCQACKHHYQHGRVASNISHADNCPRQKQPLRQNGELLCVEERNAAAAEKNIQRGGTSSTPKADESKVKKTASNKANFSSVLGATDKKAIVKTTSKKKSAKGKSGKATTGKKSDVTKKKGNTTARNTVESQESQSVTFASSSDPRTEETDTGLHQATQETFASTAVSSFAGRRICRKKRRYESECGSDSEDDPNDEEPALQSSQRSSLTRTKFTEKGFDVPLVVDTGSKKKQPVTPAPKKKAKGKSAPSSMSNADTQVKPKWVRCENPWGPSGYEEGDVVLVTPSGGFTHHESIYGGDRFTVSPFGSDSDYGVTHRTPSEGFDVIRLSRDPNAEHPWGFEYRRHEFGGACLVTAVDPLSPAASAVYRGNECEQTSGAHLRIHDMILSVNGTSIGGMTELGLSVELDVCGRELELVVARYRDPEGAAQQLVALEQREWASFDNAVVNKRRLSWFEMNSPDAKPSTRLRMLEENDFSPFALRGNNRDSLGTFGSPQVGQASLQNQPRVQQQLTPSRLSLASPGSLASRRTEQGSQKSAGMRSRSGDSKVYDDDDEAWLGCVCGEIHDEPVRVFWIQCDDCRSWYNVAPICVGFKELEASSIGTWVCRACGDSVGGDQASVRSSRPARPQACVPRGSYGKRPSVVERTTPTNLGSVFSTPGSKGSKRGVFHLTASEILESRKRRKTDNGCFLPLRSPRMKGDGTYARPCGRGPPGMVWDAIRGFYTPDPKMKDPPMGVPSKIVIGPRPPAPNANQKSTKIVIGPRPPVSSREKSICESIEKPSFVVLPAESPKNYRRTEDGYFRPLRTPKKNEDGTFARPCGRAPPGMVWDPIRGLYALKSKISADESTQQSKPDMTKASVYETTPEVSATNDEQGARTTAVATPNGRKEKSTCEGIDQFSVGTSPADPAANDRRTEDGCFRPIRPPKKKGDGTFARPCGRAPPGMLWNAIRGLYAPKSKSQTNESRPRFDTKSSSDSMNDTAATMPAASLTNEQGGRTTGTTKTSDSKKSPATEPFKSQVQKVDSVLPSSGEKLEASSSVSISSSSNGTNHRPKSSSSKSSRGSRQEREADLQKRMTDDGCLVPNTAPKANDDGTYARPRGRCPPNMVWDAQRGLYAPRSRSTRAMVPKELESTCMKLTVTSTGNTGVVFPPEDVANLSVSELNAPDEPCTDTPKKEEPKILPVGTLVKVAERVWIGCNKAGGIGTVNDYTHDEEGSVLYDVKYVLGGRERGIHCRWVVAHDFSKSGSVMRPSSDT